MNKKNYYNYNEDGFCLTEKLPNEFITNLKNILSFSKFENFKLGNTELKIFSFDLKNNLVDECLKKVIQTIQENTNIDKSFLEKNFTNRVYLTEDDINSEHRNQKFHFDSYPSIKMMIYLSDNSEDSSGSTVLLKGSAKSSLMKKINFLRYFYVPGKNGMNNNKEIDKLKKSCEKISASNCKYSALIFNTDTLHCAGKIKKENFKRLNVRFDFNLNRKSGVYLDNIYTRVSNIYSRVFN